MGPQNQYNTIIDTIERLIHELSRSDGMRLSNQQIGEKAFLEAGVPLNTREKNTLFMFLQGRTVSDYINLRRMNEACRILAGMEKWKFPYMLVDLTDVADQQSFCRKFKKYFHITPADAFKNHTTDLLCAPVYWNDLPDTQPGISAQKENVCMTAAKKRFGISRDAYYMARQAESLQQFYHLPDMESELAFSLVEKKELSLEETFEYVYNYAWRWSGENSEEVPESRDDLTRKVLLDEDILYLYFQRNLEFNDIARIMICKYAGLFDKKISAYPTSYLKGRYFYWVDEKNYDDIYHWCQVHLSRYTDCDLCVLLSSLDHGYNLSQSVDNIQPGCCKNISEKSIASILEGVDFSVMDEQVARSAREKLKEYETLSRYYGEEIIDESLYYYAGEEYNLDDSDSFERFCAKVDEEAQEDEHAVQIDRRLTEYHTRTCDDLNPALIHKAKDFIFFPVGDDWGDMFYSRSAQEYFCELAYYMDDNLPEISGLENTSIGSKSDFEMLDDEEKCDISDYEKYNYLTHHLPPLTGKPHYTEEVIAAMDEEQQDRFLYGL